MADIINPQLKRHCDEFERVAADKLRSLDVFAQAATADYTAKNLGTVINAAGASNIIDDGASIDGRTPVVGGDVYNMQTLLADFLTFLASPGRRDVIAKWQVNGTR